MSNSLFIVIGIGLVTMVILFLKSNGIRRAEAKELEKRTSFSGSYLGVHYVVEQYSHDFTTIEIKLEREIESRLEVNARKNRPNTDSDPRHADLKTLLDFGSVYIDIGFNTSRVAAEFPRTIEVNESFAHEIVNFLIRIREASF